VVQEALHERTRLPHNLQAFTQRLSLLSRQILSPRCVLRVRTPHATTNPRRCSRACPWWCTGATGTLLFAPHHTVHRRFHAMKC
jgi:hypothetical protein